MYQLVKLPFIFVLAAGKLGDHGPDLFLDHRLNRGFERGLSEDAAALIIDPVALFVNHFVILQHMFADIKVVPFDLGLRILDRPIHQPSFDRNIIFHTEAVHQVTDTFTTKAAHQFIFQTQIKAADPRVAKTAGTTTQLVINAPRLVPFGADHTEATNGAHLFFIGFGLFPLLVEHLGPPLLIFCRWVLAVFDQFQRIIPRHLGNAGQVNRFLAHLVAGKPFGVATQQNIDTTTGHVRGNRHGTGAPSLGNNRRLSLVIFRVEHLVFDAAALEQSTDIFTGFNCDRTHQHRLLALVGVDNFVDQRLKFRFLRSVDLIGKILTHHRTIGRNCHYFEIINALEFFLFGLGRTGHAGEFVIHTEEVLEGDGRQCHRLLLHLHPFFRLNRLV